VSKQYLTVLMSILSPSRFGFPARNYSTRWMKNPGTICSMEPDGHSQHLTEREQKILFQRWENQQKQEVAEQSEPTVKDIAEAYGMTPEEVTRQLGEVRAEEAQQTEAARQRRVGATRTLRGGITALVLVGLGWAAVTHLHSIHLGETSVKAAERHESQGDKAFDAANYSAAEGEYLLAVQQQPNIAMYRNNLGDALYSQKKYAQALPQYQEAVRLMPNRANYVQKLADTLLDMGRYAEALSSFRAAHALDPASTAADTGLGASLAKMNKYAEAEAAYREALRLSPADADVLDGLGAAIGEQHRIAEAAADFREAVALAPGNAQYRSNLDMAEKMLQKGEH
jgi:tetratricopeptide (TPR) repeat protein